MSTYGGCQLPCVLAGLINTLFYSFLSVQNDYWKLITCYNLVHVKVFAGFAAIIGNSPE
jgi:hypothetical protein